MVNLPAQVFIFSLQLLKGSPVLAQGFVFLAVAGSFTQHPNNLELHLK